jgi:serine/threonine-protein kinase
MKHKFLKKASETTTPTPSVAGASQSGLPPDLLREASSRLGWAALVYSATFFLAYFGTNLLFGGDPGTAVPEETLFEGARAVQSAVAIASIALGLAVFLLSRFGNLRPETLLDFGLFFLVVGSFGISMSEYWGVFPEWNGVFMYEFAGVPWEAIWILIFPFLAPNTPGKMAMGAYAAASTGMLVVLMSRSAGFTSPEMPLLYFAGYFLFTTYICAAIAIFICHTVYRFGKRLGKAMEIGSYQLLRPLGEGGMGEVWLARHRMLARPAAVKLIRAEALGDDETTRQNVLLRFEREARATAALDSFHTITLYDFGVSDEGAFYYVMELLKGLNLDELIKKFGPVPAARAVHFLHQVCHSLDEAHGRGLIHRDIKPANIYTCRLGPEHDFVKVLDFGLVKTTEGTETGTGELTAEGIATGTPAFMAPEIALGKGYIDARVDIYGLGCVGYWLLTGQRVFEGDTPLATVVAHVQEDPVPPSERSELEIPESVDAVILKCLAKDPADRPQTAAELDGLLTRCIDTHWTREQAAEWWHLHLSEVESEDLGLYALSEESQALEIMAVQHPLR